MGINGNYFRRVQKEGVTQRIILPKENPIHSNRSVEFVEYKLLFCYMINMVCKWVLLTSLIWSVYVLSGKFTTSTFVPTYFIGPIAQRYLYSMPLTQRENNGTRDFKHKWIITICEDLKSFLPHQTSFICAPLVTPQDSLIECVVCSFLTIPHN